MDATETDRPTDVQQLSKWLKALSDPNRLLIFDLLLEGVQCNCEIGDRLDMAPNLISHHMSVLRDAGLVESERGAVDARWIYHSAKREALQELNRAFAVFFDMARPTLRGPACAPQKIVRSARTSREE